MNGTLRSKREPEWLQWPTKLDSKVLPCKKPYGSREEFPMGCLSIGLGLSRFQNEKDVLFLPLYLKYLN